MFRFIALRVAFGGAPIHSLQSCGDWWGRWDLFRIHGGATSQSVIVTSSKILAERINDLAMRFGASALHVYELGSIETISAYDAPRHTDMPRADITLDSF